MKTLRLILLLLCVTTLTEAQTVYVTKTGSKYHRSGCRYLSRSKIPISLESAMKRYGPCSVCNPPTSVRSTPAVKTSARSSETKSGTSTPPPSSASTSLSASKDKVAYITSVVDGTDIIEVNLWDHHTKRTTIVTSCRNNEKVTILEEDDKYVKLRTEQGKEGWCMRSFLRQNP